MVTITSMLNMVIVEVKQLVVIKSMTRLSLMLYSNVWPSYTFTVCTHTIACLLLWSCIYKNRFEMMKRESPVWFKPSPHIWTTFTTFGTLLKGKGNSATNFLGVNFRVILGTLISWLNKYVWNLGTFFSILNDKRSAERPDLPLNGIWYIHIQKNRKGHIPKSDKGLWQKTIN